MKKEEALIELAQLINKLRNECLTGDRYLPMGDVRRYNELVHSLYGDELGEDPEIIAANELWKKKKNCKECEHYLPERPPYEVYDYCDLLQDIPDGGKACPLKQEAKE